MLKSDRWIRKMATERDMINPFSEKQVREGVVSYGLSSYGYDLRVADEFKIFTNVNSTVVDPKHFDARRGELDRQRQPIEPLANRSDERGVRVGQRKVFDNRGDALDKQLYRGETRRLSGRQTRR